ncbi:unnamed protein product [Ranitomeya imitator]|uniref:Helix-turn-helix domain-containing protein n=1 Tax=Ranitomeya imitator TaxID=111125 RepID=A0ABN9M2G2_9NEOB|nr:unnamed protein product [Ranitomeya imitator]
MVSITHLGLRNKSNFRPPQGFHTLETFIDFLQNSFHTLRGRLFYPPNRSAIEHQALKSLQEDDTLIKPAEKGSTIVVMDKYLSEISQQLEDTSIYSRLPRDPTPSISAKIDDILHKYSNLRILDSKACDYHKKKNAITPDTFFLQVRGTAMGSNVSLPYANSYMADFEDTVNYKNQAFVSNVLLWKRYIEDIFALGGGHIGVLAPVFLSPQHTIVQIDSEGYLSTDLHIKTTDRNSILHYQSFHPPSVKCSIWTSQFQQVSRIISDNSLRSQRLNEMSSKFSKSGYPPSVLENSKTPPKSTHRKHSDKRIPFVHLYHPFAFILHKAIRKHWHILSTAHPSISKFHKPFLPCFKRPPNLKDTLI